MVSKYGRYVSLTNSHHITTLPYVLWGPVYSYIITTTFQNVFFIGLVLRYLVAAGNPMENGKKTEIVDLSDPSKSCLLDDIPYRIIDSVGGLLGTTPVICGGFNMSGYLEEKMNMDT